MPGVVVTGRGNQSVAFHKSTIVPVAAAADKGHCDAFVSILRPLDLTRTIKRIEGLNGSIYDDIGK
ncbi:unnamed protein product [Clonostachys chloroleuca]|uniref:Uncharacterized protein n=1 Tax=Clonostachys chloroleuca TaxID=1926264 RepID=A0AA35MB54_9HYPO|nr:unnamed protein product [Clonostachys chloroleuca]